MSVKYIHSVNNSNYKQYSVSSHYLCVDALSFLRENKFAAFFVRLCIELRAKIAIAFCQLK